MRCTTSQQDGFGSQSMAIDLDLLQSRLVRSANRNPGSVCVWERAQRCVFTVVTISCTAEFENDVPSAGNNVVVIPNQFQRPRIDWFPTAAGKVRYLDPLRRTIIRTTIVRRINTDEYSCNLQFFLGKIFPSHVGRRRKNAQIGICRGHTRITNHIYSRDLVNLGVSQFTWWWKDLISFHLCI